MNSENEKMKLPTNIKQIGTISDEFKIYIEDYALTYIQQYAKECGCEERNAVLFGEDCIINGARVLFISGVIQGKFSEAKNGMEVMTDKTWEYINREKEKYFPGLKMLGWVYIQPGYGDYINDFHINYHNKYFNDRCSVLFVLDPIEDTSTFLRSDVDGSLRNTGGYIVYYDRNESMQDYMVENRVIKISTEEESPEGFRSSKIIRPGDTVQQTSSVNGEYKPRPRAVRSKGKLVSEQKRLVNLFGATSAVLFVVCFIMGAGLVQNDDRLRKIEGKISDIDNSYRYLLNQVNDGNTQAVFAQEQSNEQQIAQTTAAALTSAESTTESTTENTTESETEKQTDAKEENKNNQTAKVSSDYISYTVKEGDSLGIICRRIYGDDSNIDKILEINNIENPDKICAGEVIKLPN